MADTPFNFYRNRHSGEIGPALTYPRGYEDAHPEDWEGVPDAEVPKSLRAQFSEATVAAAERRKARAASNANAEDAEVVAEKTAPTPAIAPPPAPKA